eukprot:UN30208
MLQQFSHKGIDKIFPSIFLFDMFSYEQKRIINLTRRKRYRLPTFDFDLETSLTQLKWPI